MCSPTIIKHDNIDFQENLARGVNFTFFLLVCNSMFFFFRFLCYSEILVGELIVKSPCKSLVTAERSSRVPARHANTHGWRQGGSKCRNPDFLGLSRKQWFLRGSGGVSFFYWLFY